MKRLLLALAFMLTTSTALAQEEEASLPLPPPPRPAVDRFRVSAGLKIGYVATRGFDTFADSNTLPQLSLDATYTFLTMDRLSLAAGLGWDVGGRSDDLRGLRTSMATHRFLVPLEARYEALPWLLPFAKVAPGAALVVADIEDPSSPRSLSDTGWAFATDLSAGASFLIGKKRPDRRSVRVLLTPEVGWSLTTAAKLHPSPGRDDDELLGADADANVRSVALSGFFWRATVGVTF